MLSKFLDKIFRTVHRILGTLLSILFLMWFVTGIVMIYHRFPSASREEKLARFEPLGYGTLPLDSIALKNGIGLDSVRSASLWRYLGQTRYEIGSGYGNRTEFLADSSEYKVLDEKESIFRVASLWCPSPVEKVDTLYSLEQWIPFGRLKEDFPIYKFYFSDVDRTQIYISSKSKEVLQQTTRSERIWAWAGAIPHWVYFTWIRQDVEGWKSLIIWLSVFGIIMLLSGFWMAVRAFRISARKGNGLRSPYKKKWYRWHHVFGTVFGIFLLTWILSGMYSLTQIPEWLGREHKQYDSREALGTGMTDFQRYRLSLSDLLSRNPGRITKVEWKSFGSHPFYQIQLSDGESQCIDASVPQTAEQLYLDSAEVRKAVEAVHPGESISVSLMEEYDSYYLDLKGKLPLPVWKIQVDNKDRNVYYIDPCSGNSRSFNTHSKWQFQLYQGFHSLRYKIFDGRRGAWTVVMWVLLLGGAFVSLTGVVLGVKYVIRLFRRKRRKRDKE